ncbi:MAG: C-terminal binding protein [Clostridia bacterium]|nr:C-terminal binding protein [Clostridia bacterium]MBQ4416189.1 C-terminal binding protein [Butyrivibrio sp.]MBQ6427110.1 C-terminal binding protein [Clostridia bacterium]
MKYVCLDSHTLPGADYGIEKRILEENGFECVIAECRTDDEIVSAAADADAIGLIYSKISAELMDRLPQCKVLIRYGIGFDSIDIPAATERGIVVCNLPDYCLKDVSTHALALILDICRKTTYLDKSVRRGEWSGNAGWRINRIDNLTIGLAGFGNIARQLAKYLGGFDCKVIAYDPYLPEEVFRNFGVTPVSFDELCAQADVISVHTPLTTDTRHLINKDSIAKMKDGVIIVNTSRGPVISQDDIVEALKSGKVKAAGLDVNEREPLTDLDDEIYKLDNLIINPHSAYNSVEAEIEQHEKVAQSAIDVLINKIIPYNAVNKKTVKMKV